MAGVSAVTREVFIKGLPSGLNRVIGVGGSVEVDGLVWDREGRPTVWGQPGE
jgi:hypothetical protein